MKVKIAIAVAAVLVLLTAAMTVPHLWQPSGASEASEKKGDEEQSKNGIVALDEQKLASLELKVEPAGVHPLLPILRDPGNSATTVVPSVTRYTGSAITSPITAAVRSHLVSISRTESSRPFFATTSIRSCDSLSRIS